VFLKYTIQAAFFSNGLLLLDVGHQIIVWFKKRAHKSSQQYRLKPQPFIDAEPFDLGERQAIALVMFSMGLFFTGTSPLQSMFSCLYFSIKYWIEKYNLAFVYTKQYEGKGIIWKPMVMFMILILYIFQLLTIGYFTIISKSFFNAGGVFLLIEITGFLLLAWYKQGKKKQDKFEISLLE
jgi:hypothetical protein